MRSRFSVSDKLVDNWASCDWRWACPLACQQRQPFSTLRRVVRRDAHQLSVFGGAARARGHALPVQVLGCAEVSGCHFAFW